MLIAAMILGLIGGIAYFIGGTTGLTGVEWEPTPWWAVAMIPVGLVGTIGGALPRWKPLLAGGLLILAGVSALAIGIATAEELFGGSSGAALSSGMVSVHPFMGSAFYLPPLFALVVGGALALAANKGAVTKPTAPAITFLR